MELLGANLYPSSKYRSARILLEVCKGLVDMLVHSDYCHNVLITEGKTLCHNGLKTN